MAKKTISIMFLNGGIIPASVLSLKADKVCEPFEAVTVPYEYGKHMLDDKFAVPADETSAAKATEISSLTKNKLSDEVAAARNNAHAAIKNAEEDAATARTNADAAIKNAEEDAATARTNANVAIKQAEDDATEARDAADALIKEAELEATNAIDKINAAVVVQQKIADAKVAIYVAGTDTVAKDAAEAALKDAEAELTALKA